MFKAKWIIYQESSRELPNPMAYQLEKAVKFVELFAGIGGFRFGLEASGQGKSVSTRSSLRYGGNRSDDNECQRPKGNKVTSRTSPAFDCIYANEYDKYARSVYRYHYGDIDGRDITTVPPDEIPDADLWTFGAPCQDFSVAGKRRGLEGDRGNLFLYTLELLAIKRPPYFLAENVPGLLSIDGGRAFAHIIGQIAQMGYVCQWLCLNSKDFGVPQNRERVFLVGSARGEPRPEILSFGEDTSGVTEGATVAATLQCPGHSGGHHSGMTLVLPRAGSHGPQGYDENHPPKCLVDGIRHLTPLETERLQGFPDSWTARGIDDNGKEVEISDTQRYRQCGNAVSTPVIAHFGRALRRLR